MKRLLCLLLSLALLIFAFGCAEKPEIDVTENNSQKPDKIIDQKKAEEILGQLSEKIENTPSVEIDIKPLEETDKELLLDAAKGLGFENVKLFEAFANAIGKKPQEVSQSDIDAVHYVAVGPESDDTYTVYIGYIDYVDLCLSDTDPDQLMSKLNEVVMISEFNYDMETDTLEDLAKFKNVEMFEIYNVYIDDVSFIKAYQNLIFGYFNDNGIEDVSALSDYNPASLAELDFTNNSISDWSYLEHIKDKVIVFYGEIDGMPMTITLVDKLEQDAVKQEEMSDEPEFFDENGEKADFGSLFD